MKIKLLRLTFVFEFLVAMVAIFTAWSEVGGQSVLDAMAWYWKLGLSVLLSAAIVGYSAALVAEEKLWSFRSAKWAAGILLALAAIGIVTLYFQLQSDDGNGDDSSTRSYMQSVQSLTHLS